MLEMSFDYRKSDRNEFERGLPFTIAEHLDWSLALIEEDIRKAYGERRYRALVTIANRLHALVFTPRGSALHVISLRRANAREVKYYGHKTQS